MVVAWTATMFRQFFDSFLSICLGESAEQPKAWFHNFLTILWNRPENIFLIIFPIFLFSAPWGDTSSITPGTVRARGPAEAAPGERGVAAENAGRAAGEGEDFRNGGAFGTAAAGTGEGKG